MLPATCLTATCLPGCHCLLPGNTRRSTCHRYLGLPGWVYYRLPPDILHHSRHISGRIMDACHALFCHSSAPAPDSAFHHTCNGGCTMGLPVCHRLPRFLPAAQITWVRNFWNNACLPDLPRSYGWCLLNYAAATCRSPAFCRFTVSAFYLGSACCTGCVTRLRSPGFLDYRFCLAWFRLPLWVWMPAVFWFHIPALYTTMRVVVTDRHLPDSLP